MGGDGKGRGEPAQAERTTAPGKKPQAAAICSRATASLIHLHTTVLLPPPVVGLFADAKLTNGLSDRFALTGPYLCLTKVSDDLLCGVTLSRHAIPFARVPNPNFGNGNIPGGQVNNAKLLLP